MRSLPTFFLFAILRCASAITIYTSFTTGTDGLPLKPTQTNTATGPAYTGFTAYNTTKLIPPILPNPMPNLNIAVQLYAGGMQGLSIKQKGNFMGLSIELSVANQFLGRNSSKINVPFLNYVANLKSRMGQGPAIRVGGNSQEHTELFFEPFDDHYEVTNKTLNTNPNNPTITPEVNVWIDLLYMMLNITTMTSTQWYLGLPYGYPVNITGIAIMAKIYEDVLGDNLIALQLGNEPDLYGIGNRDRPDAYPVSEYITEYGTTIDAMKQVGLSRENIVLSPSVCCNVGAGGWSIKDVLDGGLLTDYSDTISQLAVQRYPRANCDGSYQAQDVFSDYLIHSSVVRYLADADYADAAAQAVAAGKPFIMFETNTASCSGFSGISDSFGASLWAVDWTMQLAYRNFSNGLFHFGGQDASYNAFTPPPSNYSSEYQWTTGAIYYSMLMVAEAMGSSNVSQVLDLNLNADDNGNANPYTPGYVIYENNQPARVVLINYMDDGGTGTGAYQGYIHIGGIDGLADTTPTSVTVRYLAGNSVSDKFNITWAGQNAGNDYWMSDGRMQGDVVTKTIQCATDTGCPIRVPAPGAALIFLSAQAQSESYNDALSATYSTSWFSKGGGPTVDSSVLETSNGQGGKFRAQYPLGATSHGSANNENSATSVRAQTRWAVLGGTLAAVGVGAAVVGRMLIL